jgi:chromosome segregation ATPase
MKNFRFHETIWAAFLGIVCIMVTFVPDAHMVWRVPTTILGAVGFVAIVGLICAMRNQVQDKLKAEEVVANQCEQYAQAKATAEARLAGTATLEQQVQTLRTQRDNAWDAAQANLRLKKDAESDRDRYKKETEAAVEQAENLEKANETATGKLQTSEEQVKEQERRIQSLTEQVNGASQQVTELTDKLNAAKGKAKKRGSRIHELEVELAGRPQPRKKPETQKQS